jgi:rubredoxin
MPRVPSWPRNVVWYDTSKGPIDPGNEVGKWPSGWLNGEWKCPICHDSFGRDLRGRIPWMAIAIHKAACEVKQTEKKEAQPTKWTCPDCAISIGRIEGVYQFGVDIARHKERCKFIQWTEAKK